VDFFTSSNSNTEISSVSDLISKIKENCQQVSASSNESDSEETRRLASKARAKLRAGKKLNGKELAALRASDPELYKQAVRVQNMRKSLEARLSSAKSREEVSSIISSAMGMVSDEDPAGAFISAAFSDAISEFCQSSDYQKLPATNEELDRTSKNKSHVTEDTHDSDESFFSSDDAIEAGNSADSQNLVYRSGATGYQETFIASDTTENRFHSAG